MRHLALALMLLGACKKDDAAAPPPGPVAAPAPAGPQRIALTVTEKGFEPTPVKVKAGEPLTLVVTRTTDKTCATEIVIEGEGINKPLPLNEPVEIAFTPKKAGELKYGCGMGQMVSGVLLVE